MDLHWGMSACASESIIRSFNVVDVVLARHFLSYRVGYPPDLNKPMRKLELSLLQLSHVLLVVQAELLALHRNEMSGGCSNGLLMQITEEKIGARMKASPPRSRTSLRWSNPLGQYEARCGLTAGPPYSAFIQKLHFAVPTPREGRHGLEFLLVN